MSERKTCLRHSPLYLHRADHFFQNFSVSRSNADTFPGSGAGSFDGCQTKSKKKLCPLATVKSETVVRPSPRSCTFVQRRNLSGPPVAVMPCESCDFDS